MRAIVLAFLVLLSLALFAAPSLAGASDSGAVTVYHADPARLGNYVAPGLTPQVARTLHRDPGFDGRVEGAVYAQPLFWRPPGAPAGRVIVATEEDVVYALDAATGRPVWTARLGHPAPRSALDCGNIDPLGVTGTPVIDPATGALYLDAMVMLDGAPHHLAFGLSLANGKILPGWPIDVATALARRRENFDPRIQNQRAALALLDGRIYVGFGGHSGDCGPYHGIVTGFAIHKPHLAALWMTRGEKGGIWAPNGIGVADGHLYFATGNTATGADWADGEAIFRLGPDLARRPPGRDVFIPRDWKHLDDVDQDISGTGPLPIDVRGTHRLLALGKNGVAYLLNRENLGGFGGELTQLQVAHSPIVEGPAVFPHGDRQIVIVAARNAVCPDGNFTGGIVALALGLDSITPLWCAPFSGRASPVVTTTDGRADPIAWIAGADRGRELRGYDAITGELLFESAPMDDRIAPFQTLLVAGAKIYLPMRGRIVAFGWAR